MRSSFEEKYSYFVKNDKFSIQNRYYIFILTKNVDIRRVTILVGNDQTLHFLREGPGDPVIGKRYFLKLSLK